MSNEGEFKRRLTQHFEDYGGWDCRYEKNDKTFYESEIYDWIDEMKKEFENNLIKTFPDMHDYFEEEAKDVADNWRDKFLKRFYLKWFEK